MRQTSFFFAFIALLAVAPVSTLSAQGDWCATPPPPQQWEAVMQKLIAEQNAVNSGMKVTQSYVVPVIVHVIHGGQTPGVYPNLAQGQVVSQVRVLNEDFGGVGYNYANYPFTAYAGWANNTALPLSSLDNLGRVARANCGVQFCLAAYDTMGNPLAEPGIDRVNYVTKGWQNPASFTSMNSFKTFIDGTVKPQTIWNPTKYFNLWITDEAINSIGLLGYATFPVYSGLTGLPGSFGTPTTDGVWCYSRAFGSATYFPGGYYTSGNNRGRTASHEVGHWVGLRHIWGDATCGNDYCDDTPPATASNFGAPSYPLKVGNCSGNAPNGEMFMNFMDYTDDGIKYMFTPDQAQRVQTAMANSPYRKLLGSHNLCNVQTAPATAQFVMQSTVCEGAPVVLNNSSSGVPAPSYTWTGDAGTTFSPDQHAQTPVVTFTMPGVHSVTLTSSNGSVATVVKTISVDPSPVIGFQVNSVPVTSNTISVCQGDQQTIFFTGGLSFTLMPGATTDPFVTFSGGDIDQSFTVTTMMDGCTSSTELFLVTDPCTGMSHVNIGVPFGVFPVPATDRVYIKHVTPGAVVSITDLSGRELNVDIARDGEMRVVNLQGVAPGIYFAQVITGDTVRAVKIVRE